jgi:uncharacterized protein (TIGR03083 family)
MDVADHLAALRRDGSLLASVAAANDLDAPIPTCPDWRMRDLVQHVGDVHRWAAAHVAERRTEPIRKVEEIAGPLPDDGALVGWFREGHARLLETLESADPDVRCWSFLPAPSPLAFWARRQAHETAIHRADAESPGGPITAFDAPFASDGIDELLFGFFARPVEGDEIDTQARTLRLHATGDDDTTWSVRIAADGMRTRRGGPHAEDGGSDGADCSVDGSASDLYLLLWNRRPPEGLRIVGDDSVLTLWRDNAQIRWSRAR